MLTAVAASAAGEAASWAWAGIQPIWDPGPVCGVTCRSGGRRHLLPWQSPRPVWHGPSAARLQARCRPAGGARAASSPARTTSLSLAHGGLPACVCVCVRVHMFAQVCDMCAHVAVDAHSVCECGHVCVHAVNLLSVTWGSPCPAPPCRDSTPPPLTRVLGSE